MAQILLIDNYDSFTYNLVQLIEEACGETPDILKNDELTDLDHYDHVIISPGPGLPAEAGSLMNCNIWEDESTQILGVCLGLQAIAIKFGAGLSQLPRVHHGVKSQVSLLPPGNRIFQGIDTTFAAGRYHSWVVPPHSVRSPLQIDAIDENGEIMALSHQSRPVFGVQFHPESIMTAFGERMMRNFLRN